jgi:hypothetical protein
MVTIEAGIARKKTAKSIQSIAPLNKYRWVPFIPYIQISSVCAPALPHVRQYKLGRVAKAKSQRARRTEQQPAG